jgi:hypothetical protein
VKVSKEHVIDASEPDAAGHYDYYYAYWLYRFEDSRTTLIARREADLPGERAASPFAPQEKAAFRDRPRRQRKGSEKACLRTRVATIYFFRSRSTTVGPFRGLTSQRREFALRGMWQAGSRLYYYDSAGSTNRK